MLKGYRTYLSALATVVYTLLQFRYHDIGATDTVIVVLAALSLIFNRAAVGNLETLIVSQVPVSAPVVEAVAAEEAKIENQAK